MVSKWLGYFTPSQPLWLYQGEQGMIVNSRVARLNTSTFPFALTRQFGLYRVAACSTFKTDGSSAWCSNGPPEPETSRVSAPLGLKEDGLGSRGRPGRSIEGFALESSKPRLPWLQTERQINGGQRPVYHDGYIKAKRFSSEQNILYK